MRFLSNRFLQTRRQWRLIWQAWHDSRVPLPAKIIVIAAILYAISPFDFVPDYIPVLGMLDDLLFVPLAIRLAIRLVPAPVAEEYREAMLGVARISKWEVLLTGLLIILLWMAGLYLVFKLMAAIFHWIMG